MSVRANFADIHLRGIRDAKRYISISMRSGTELVREIQLTDWSTAGEQGKLVFAVSTEPSLAHLFHFSQREKYCLSIVQVTHQLFDFHFKIPVKKKRRK